MSSYTRVLASTLLLVLLIPVTQGVGQTNAELIGSATVAVPQLIDPVNEMGEPQPTHLKTAVDVAVAEAAGVSANVLELALGAVTCATAAGEIGQPPTLTLIDYSKPSVEPRLWVFDLASGKLLFKELVAHGRNTGENLATAFSDRLNSHQSSIGLFVTQDTYTGSNGYSLRMEGLEPGFNGRARERAIVMHGAPYVSEEIAMSQGRLGRSWGCPALRQAIARNVIDTVRGGGVVFSYYPDAQWLSSSRFLNGCGAAN